MSTIITPRNVTPLIKQFAFRVGSPLAGDTEIGMFFLADEFVVGEMVASFQGGTGVAVAWSMKFATNHATISPTEVVVGGNVTSNANNGNTTGHSITTFTNPIIPARRFVFMTIETVGATGPDTFNVSVIRA